MHQLIVNSYIPGEGLAPHIDLAAFADGIVVVSLEASIVMDFYPPATQPTSKETIRDDVKRTQVGEVDGSGVAGLGNSEGGVGQLRGEGEVVEEEVATAGEHHGVFESRLLAINTQGTAKRARVEDPGHVETAVESVSLDSARRPSTIKPISGARKSELSLWLHPGDVMFLSGPARWEWRHGIASRAWDWADETEADSRVSARCMGGEGSGADIDCDSVNSADGIKVFVGKQSGGSGDDGFGVSGGDIKDGDSKASLPGIKGRDGLGNSRNDA